VSASFPDRLQLLLGRPELTVDFRLFFWADFRVT
jgi:hypothetical protein